jgi:hypothetical protein
MTWLLTSNSTNFDTINLGPGGNSLDVSFGNKSVNEVVVVPDILFENKDWIYCLKIKIGSIV